MSHFKIKHFAQRFANCLRKPDIFGSCDTNYKMQLTQFQRLTTLIFSFSTHFKVYIKNTLL
jgi:hypothetical protein